jgi:hypothetical protein
MEPRSPIRLLLDGDRESPGYWRLLGLLESRVAAVVCSRADAEQVDGIIRETMHLFLDALPKLGSEREVLNFLIHTLRHVLADFRDEDRETGFRDTGDESGPDLVRGRPVSEK